MKINILALDIDGVLNYTTMPHKVGEIAVCRERVKLLQRIVQISNAAVILSSTWRIYSQPLMDLRRLLDEYGISITGCTPEFGSGTPRCAEILDYVMTHYLPHSFRLAVLDDWASASTEKYTIESKMFETCFAKGLTPEITDSIIQYFGASSV